MKIGKKLLTTVGAMALIASSVAMGGVATAQSSNPIQTTISVTNSNPACSDERVTSFTMTPPTGGLNFTRTGGSPLGNTQSRVFTLNYYVNECLDQEWRVTANMTQFTTTSSSDTIPAGAIFVRGMGTWPGAGNLVRPGGFTAVDGTAGLASGTNRHFNQVDPAGGWTINTDVATGTAEVSGELQQHIETRLSTDQTIWPLGQPGGVYTSTLTLTFTSNGP